MAELMPASSIENLPPQSLELEDELREEIRTIERRLRKGEEILRTQKEAGGDHEVLARLELGWIKLLRRYELLCDRLQRRSIQRSDSTRARLKPSAVANREAETDQQALGEPTRIPALNPR